jgi:alpha-tubulin suppressor-like RCC1 family protein
MHDYQDLEHYYSRPYNSYGEAFIRKIKRIGRPRIWFSEQGVDLQNGRAATSLANSTQSEDASRQRLAAKDFLRLGGAHLSHELSRVEVVDYYLYRGPSKEYQEEKSHAFDSALLPGEAVAEENHHPAENPRQAYCVLALDLSGCPATTVTHGVLAGTTTSSGGTVSFNVNPQGSATTYYVEYGLTPGYGKTTTLTLLPGENGEQSVTAALSGLETCTTYHYQAEATNKANEEAGNPALGGDETFQTTGCPASILSVSDEHACGPLTGGKVGCWGENTRGALGDPELAEGAILLAPHSVDGITNATVVASYFSNSCALLATGHIECWGDNSRDQLGGGTETETSATPVEVGKITNATSVALGNSYACALLATGRIDCWGDDESCQLGTTVKLEGCEGTCSAIPVTVEGIENATSLSLGGRHACAVLSTGHVKCWGYGQWGALGNGSESNSTTPVEVSGVTSATEVSAGGASTCALLSADNIDCWGANWSGQLGNGSRENSLTPVGVVGIENASYVSEAESSGCALLATGHVDCWGSNEYGELGNGERESGPENCAPESEGGSACSVRPVAVEGISSVTEISESQLNGCALETGGVVYCWGANNAGLLGYTEKLGGEVGLPTRITGFP